MALAFTLPDTDGTPTPLHVEGAPAAVVVFTCNHCPYALAWHERIQDVARDYADRDVRVLQINANNAARHPRDSFEAMKARVDAGEFAGPYLHDETQEVARAYDAVCTPDFFGFDRDLALAYRGRLDASGRSSDPTAPRELFDAMLSIARGGAAPAVQHVSVGCSIKWKRG